MKRVEIRPAFQAHCNCHRSDWYAVQVPLWLLGKMHRRVRRLKLDGGALGMALDEMTAHVPGLDETNNAYCQGWLLFKEPEAAAKVADRVDLLAALERNRIITTS